MIKSKKFIFSSTIGDDIEVDVFGEWCPPEKDVGYTGNFHIEKVSLPNSDVNLRSALAMRTWDRLLEEGFAKGSEEYDVQNR